MSCGDGIRKASKSEPSPTRSKKIPLAIIGKRAELVADGVDFVADVPVEPEAAALVARYEPVQIANDSVRVTVTTPSLRTVLSYTTSAWHPVHRG